MEREKYRKTENEEYKGITKIEKMERTKRELRHIEK